MSNGFSQDGFEGIVLERGQFKIASFCDVCKQLEMEIDLAKCNQDQIKEFIVQLKTPAIIERKQLIPFTV